MDYRPPAIAGSAERRAYEPFVVRTVSRAPSSCSKQLRFTIYDKRQVIVKIYGVNLVVSWVYFRWSF